MSEEKALVPAQQMSWQDTMALGRVLAVSKRFSDSTNAEQAVVKVLAGRELGFGPIASMVGIYIIKGRVSVSANMMAQAVKRSIKYDYQIVEMTAERCEIAFFERGKDVGHSVFDEADAQKAGTQNMKKFPRNMLFARTMSNGVKWYCPDVFQTGVYTPEELGALVDGDGEIINVTSQPAQGPQKEEPLELPHWIDRVSKDGRPIRAAFWAWATELTLSNDDVHEALEVESVRDYKGTMGEAKAAVLAYIDRKIAEADDKEAAQEPPPEELEF